MNGSSGAVSFVEEPVGAQYYVLYLWNLYGKGSSPVDVEEECADFPKETAGTIVGYEGTLRAKVINAVIVTRWYDYLTYDSE